jgi:hypothetical protein
MAHSLDVADGGNSFQILKAAANVLNKESRVADKGCSSRCEFCVEQTALHRRKPTCFARCYRGPRDLRRREGTPKTDLREIVLEGVDWIHLARDRERLRSLVKTVRNSWVS